ncbi:MAG: sugar ABC transporter ATP-binding protein [Phycisphaerales bacterium JB039]
MTAPEHPLLEALSVEKAFPGVRALRGVSLGVAAGETLAVIGENGAGKSTLMKILAGAEQPDVGEIRLDGAACRFRSIQDAMGAGVALIHQELKLAGNLDVAANISLGREPRRFGVIDRPAVREIARRRLAEVGLAVSPSMRTGALPIGKRQMVEIAKALSREARIIIFDEPTSSLTLGEIERLFAVIRQLRARGVAVIYISHRLAEVEQIADRVVALRDGAVAGELSRSAISHDAMVRLMIGRDLGRFYQRTQRTTGEAALEVRSWRTVEFPSAAPISMEVRSGEIVALAGLVGAGRTELLESFFGVAGRLDGELRIDGEPVEDGAGTRAIASGLAMVPEDRQRHGLVLEQSIRRNIALPQLRRRQRLGFADGQAECRSAGQTITRLGIRASSDRQRVETLSGGNQQKIVLGKWLALSPRVLLLDEPTRGVDIGARAEIYRQMEELAAAGMAILFASSDMEEIIGMADRVLVLRDGALAGEVAPGAITEEAIMRLATGADGTGAAA